MIQPPRRRFTIADGMILIVAAALASLMVREYVSSLFLVYKASSSERMLELIEGTTTCAASAGMLALIPIRLLRPRPKFRRLVRQPGFVACCAIVPLLALVSLESSMLVAFRDVEKAWGGRWPFQQLWALAAFRGSFAVGGAWIVLALGGRWSPEASWVDRLGRGLGLVWVIWLPIHPCYPWIVRLLPAL